MLREVRFDRRGYRVRRVISRCARHDGIVGGDSEDCTCGQYHLREQMG